MRKEVFAYLVAEDLYFLKYGIFWTTELKAKAEESRHKPHIYYSAPYYVEVLPDKHGNLSKYGIFFEDDKIKFTFNKEHEIIILNKIRELDIQQIKMGIKSFKSLYPDCIVCPIEDDASYELNVCRWCGEMISADLKPRERGKRIFCDNTCKKEYENFETSYKRLLELGKIEPFIKKLYELAKKESPLVCMLNVRNELLKTRVCESCGKPIPLDKRLNARFCCDSCKDKYFNSLKKK